MTLSKILDNALESCNIVLDKPESDKEALIHSLIRDHLERCKVLISKLNE